MVVNVAALPSYMQGSISPTLVGRVLEQREDQEVIFGGQLKMDKGSRAAISDYLADLDALGVATDRTRRATIFVSDLHAETAVSEGYSIAQLFDNIWGRENGQQMTQTFNRSKDSQAMGNRILTALAFARRAVIAYEPVSAIQKGDKMGITLSNEDAILNGWSILDAYAQAVKRAILSSQLAIFDVAADEMSIDRDTAIRDIAEYIAAQSNLAYGGSVKAHSTVMAKQSEGLEAVRMAQKYSVVRILGARAQMGAAFEKDGLIPNPYHAVLPGTGSWQAADYHGIFDFKNQWVLRRHQWFPAEG